MATVRPDAIRDGPIPSSEALILVERPGEGQTSVAVAFGGGGPGLPPDPQPPPALRRARAELAARSWTHAASRPRPNQPMANGTCPLAGAIG